MSQGRQEVRRSVAMDLAKRLQRELGTHISRCEPVGSLRRGRPTVHDIDLLVQVRTPIKWNLERIRHILHTVGNWNRGADRMMVVDDLFGHRGLTVDVFLVYPPRNFNALLALRTGPAADTIALKEGLERHNRRKPFSELVVASEREMYSLAGLPWVEPNERENH